MQVCLLTIECLVYQCVANTDISGVLSTLDRCYVSFEPVLYRPHTQTRVVFFLGFPDRVPVGFSQIAFPMTVLLEDDRYRFRSRGKTGSFMLDHDLGHLCRGRRLQISGHSDFGIFSNVGASFHFDLGVSGYCICCLSCASSLEVMYMTLAAFICDADDPCSVITAYDPESSFTMSPRSTTLPLYF